MSDSIEGQGGVSRWTQRGFIAAAIVVALLIVLGVVLAVTGPAKDPGAQPAPGPSTSSAAPATSDGASAQDSACGLPAGDQQVPRTAPTDTRWELVGTIAAPTAPDTHGPGRVDDGLRTCFAHTPTGALYAAVNFVAAAGTDALRERAVAELAAAGAGRDRAIEEAQGPANGAGSQVQVQGFTVLNYDSDASTVDLAFRATRSNGSSGLAHMPMSLVWEAGDWKVSLPATGEVFPGVGPIPDMTGYVPWGGA